MRSKEFITELNLKHHIDIHRVDDNIFAAEIAPEVFLTLQFDEITPTLLGINFDVNGEQHLTGKGHQFTIGAIVLKIINEHLLEFITDEIETVFFSAKVEKNNNYSRINLYYKQGEPLISNLLNTVGSWEFKPAKHSSEVHFIWERK